MKSQPLAKLLAAICILLILGAAIAQDTRYYLYGGGQFPPGEAVSLYTWLDGQPATDLTLYRVDNPEQLLALGGPNEFEVTDGLELTEIATREVIEAAPNESTDIDLGVLPIGLYLAQLGDAATGTATLVLVTDLAMVSKWDGSNLLIYTSNLTSGEPVDAEVLQRLNEGVSPLETEPGGLTVLPVEYDSEDYDDLPLAAHAGDSWAFGSGVWSRWAADVPSIYLVTDRPVYRPGHTVFIKGTARLGRSVAPVAGQEVTVTVADADYEELLDTTVITDEYGSFSLELDLGDAAPLGYYSVSAAVGGSSSWGSFWVEEYTKPEYDVTVTAGVPWAIQGDSASFSVAAEYLFGGPVGGGSVDYVVMSEPYSPWAWRSEYGFYDTYSSTYGGQVIARGEATLGPDGTLEVPVDLQAQDNDYRLTLQASVSDESEASISGSASLIAYRADLVLGVNAERYAHPLGETVELTITARDLEGNPLSTDFVLDTERRYWDRDAEEEVTVPGSSYSGRTDAQGTATITIEPTEAGSWWATASATDAAGRATDNQTSLWVYGGDATYWDYSFLEVTADKDEYSIGDIARFVVQSPVADGWALVTSEGGALSDWQLIRFDGTSFTHEVEVTGRDLPNSTFGVIVVGDGEIYQANTDYLINPGSRFLNVEISSDANTFEPGSSTELEVRVTDEAGNPVQAQLTVGLVDEAIYLVRSDTTQDIRGFFYGYRGNSVWTNLSSYTYFGQIQPVASAAREAMDEAVFAQAKDSAAAQANELAEAELREDFRDTIVWLPDIETDADGRATVDVTFPDNLTEWRLTVRAITQDGLVGQDTHSVTTTLPVIARLALPGQLVQGDETRIRLIGQNNLETDIAGQFDLSVDGLELQSGPVPGSELTIPATGRATADWQAVATETGDGTVQGEVLTSEASDALSLPVTVVPHAIAEELVWADAGTSDWLFSLPAGTVEGTAQGNLLLTPDFTAAVSPALNWLVGLDYGYTELTMSRLLATVLAAQAGQELPEQVTDLDEYVADGLRDLYLQQHPDGGWGIGRYDVSHPMISAFVTSGLLELQRAGYEIRGWALQDSLSYLEAAIAKDSFEVYSGIDDAQLRNTLIADAKASMGFALARGRRLVPQQAGLASDPALSNHGLAEAVLALQALGRDVEAELYLDELLSRVNSGDATAYWESGAPRYYWSDDRAETTALALQALQSMRPDSELIPRVVNWLLLERNGSHWYSSKATLAVVQAALQLDDPAAGADPQSVTVRLNGELLAEVTLTDQPVNVPLDGLNSAGRNLLEVESGSGGVPFVSAAVSFMHDDAFSRALADGITVERTYELLEPVWIEAEQHYEYERHPLDGLAVGDFVVATVTITPEAPLNFVQVTEPVPAGFSVVEDDYSFRLAGIPRRYGEDYWGWNYWYDAREIRDLGIDYWFSRIDEPVTFTYILRAEHPGEFAALPTQARLLYERDTYGRSAAERLGIGE